MRDRWGRPYRPWIFWICLGFSLGLLWGLVSGLSRAHAHDHGRPELDKWYKSLRTDSGPCCDGSDAKVVEEPDWESLSGGYRVKIDGKWINVPASAVLPGPNHDGRTMVWPYRSGDETIVRCFLRGLEM